MHLKTIVLVPWSYHRGPSQPFLTLQVVALVAEDGGVVASTDHHVVTIVIAGKGRQRLHREVRDVSLLTGLGQGQVLEVRYVTGRSQSNPDHQSGSYRIFPCIRDPFLF